MRFEQVQDIKGFFDKAEETYTSDMHYLFGAMSESEIETIDFLLSSKLGNKKLLEKFEKKFIQSGADNAMGLIVDCVFKLHSDEWKRFKDDVDLLDTIQITQGNKETRVLSRNVAGRNNDETQNKMNAYDSETASDTDSTARQGESESTEELTETKTHSNGVINFTKEKIDFTKNYNLIEIIFNDINNVCLTCIY